MLNRVLLGEERARLPRSDLGRFALCDGSSLWRRLDVSVDYGCGRQLVTTSGRCTNLIFLRGAQARNDMSRHPKDDPAGVMVTLARGSEVRVAVSKVI